MELFYVKNQALHYLCIELYCLRMKTWIKRIGIFLSIPTILAMIVSLLLYIPSFQNFAVRQAMQYASEATGMHIQMERIRLSFPIRLKVQGLLVMPDTIPADTLLSLKELQLQIRPWPLLSKELLVESVGLKQLKLNTGNLIEGMVLKGGVRSVLAKADRISFSSEKATLNKLDLTDAALTLVVTDTTSRPDTVPSEPLNWLFSLDKIDLNRVALALQIPQDSMRVAGFIQEAKLRDGKVDLGNSRYGVKSFRLSQSIIRYDIGEQAALPGIDPSHLALSDVNISLGSLLYSGKELGVVIDRFAFKERSGFEVTKFQGKVKGDSTSLKVPELTLLTPHTAIDLETSIPYTAFNKQPKGELNIHLDGKVGKDDVMALLGDLPESFVQAYPDKELELCLKANGNMKKLELEKAEIRLPGAFDLEAKGYGVWLHKPDKREADLALEGRTDNLGFLLDYLPEESRGNWNIPRHMTLTGDAKMRREQFKTDLLFKEGNGKILLSGAFDQHDERYKVQFAIDSLEPVHFMPNDSLYWMNAKIEVAGQGLNPYDSLAWMKLEGAVSDMRYGKASISDITMKGSLKENNLLFDLNSNYPLAKMDASLNAFLREERIKAMLIADMQHIDLESLHISDVPLTMSFQIFAEAETDMKEKYDADLTLGNWELTTVKGVSRPKTLVLKTRTNYDSTFVSFHAGDLELKMEGNMGPMRLGKQWATVSGELSRQLLQDSAIYLNKLHPLLPETHIQLTAKRDNPIYNFLQIHYMGFKEMQVDAFVSPEKGIGLNAHVHNFLRDTFLLDTMKLAIAEDSVGRLLYQADVIKRKFKRQDPFSLNLSGQLRTRSFDALLRMEDGKGNVGILMGTNVEKEKSGGVSIHFFPDNPILAFSNCTLNPDNYIRIQDMNNMEANFDLRSDNGAYLEIASEEVDSSLNRVNAAFGQIRLKEVSRVFSSYLPNVSGMFNADVQYMPSDSSFTMTVGFNVDSLFYEGKRVGDLLLSTVYLPLSENEHQFDMHFFRDAEEFVQSSLYYRDGKQDSIMGNLSVTEMPLEMLNPFIPGGMAELKGKLLGEISVDGTTGNPDIQGYLQMDSANMFVEMANTTVRFDSKEIGIYDKKIWFNKYKLFASGENPFVINGAVDFSDMSNMTADLKLNARNMQLLNAKRTKQSWVYGKMFVNWNSTVKGPLESLKMRGDLQLLGGTNFTYVLHDSPLTVQDRLSGLVSFTSFDEDTLLMRKRNYSVLPLSGLDMLMTIHIDQAVQINADLTPDQSNHVKLEGGGDLSFQYTPMGDMILNGRYTLTDGTIKYTLPVIPLKEFNVQEGSYVQWTGDVMNPSMDITATERVRTSATLDDNSSRMVNFDVGIQLTQTLENLGLKFILKAPEDASVQEQLARMGEEELAKQAVSMLVSGMYLGGGLAAGKSNLDMGAALNSFLQSEINSIAGSALKTVDINFGMESYDDAESGGKRTDYSFRFAKRFYNDRIRIVLGGRISTGADINQGQAQPFIDNVSVEYRLDRGGTRYVKLFHNKDYESLLEGELTETGAGIVLHKKMDRLRELFIFKRAKKVKPEKDDEEEKDEKN